MFQEYFIYNIVQVLAAQSGTVFTDVNLNISSNDFLFKRTIHNSTDNRIYMKIFDQASGRFLFKGAEDLRGVSGNRLTGITTFGFVPYNWPHPYRSKRNNIMTFSFSDFSVAQNTLNIAFHGDGVSEGTPLDRQGKPVDYMEKRTTVPIIYESPTITPANGIGQIAQGVLITDNDADFVCTKITGICTDEGYVTIQDLKRDTFWQNQKTFASNLFGNGQFPNVLTSPRFIGANTNLLITFENNVAGANALKIYFHGYKRF